MTSTLITQIDIERTLVWFCKQIGGSQLEGLMIREFQKRGVRPTPPRVYTFPSFLIIDRPFSLLETVFVHGELAVEGLQIARSRRLIWLQGRKHQICARVTNRKRKSRRGIEIRATHIRSRDLLVSRTNFRGKCNLTLPSEETIDLLVVAMIDPSMGTETFQDQPKKVIEITPVS